MYRPLPKSYQSTPAYLVHQKNFAGIPPTSTILDYWYNVCDIYNIVNDWLTKQELKWCTALHNPSFPTIRSSRNYTSPPIIKTKRQEMSQNVESHPSFCTANSLRFPYIQFLWKLQIQWAIYTSKYQSLNIPVHGTLMFNWKFVIHGWSTMSWGNWPRNLPPGVLLVVKIPVTHTATEYQTKITLIFRRIHYIITVYLWLLLHTITPPILSQQI
jgi:hypothetical protein